MSRWVLHTLLLAVVGVLGILVGLCFRIMHEGIPVKLSEPFSLESPVSVKLAQPVDLAGPLAVEVKGLPLVIPGRFAVEVASPVRAEAGFLSCPGCGQGLLIPVRFSLFSGAITWRCTLCDYEFGP